MRRKLAGLFICVVLALVCLLLRMTYISASKGDQYTRQVLERSAAKYSSVSMAYKRGDIVDRNGTVLASSEKKYNLIVDCFVINSSDNFVEPTIKCLVEVLGMDEGEMRSLIENEATKESRYQVVRKHLSIEEKKAYDKYRYGTDDEPLTTRQAAERYYIRGIWFEEEYVRNYPNGVTAGEVIGFTYGDGQADWGIEGYFNNTLSGVDGRKYGYFGSDTNIEQTIIEPVDGDSVRSTIDVNIQRVVENTINAFEDIYKDGPYATGKGAENIGVVVMDPNDGSILAMASSTGYDPNDPRNLSGYYTDAQIEAMSSEQKAHNLQEIWRNFCISDAFEPGSVIKPVTVASALESGAVSQDASFICDGFETVAGVRIKCSDMEGHGEETLGDVIRNSCNDGIMQIGSLMGVDNFCRYQKIFNFGMKTGIDLSGEAAGMVGQADTMGSIHLATASFGQGFTCTMIQEAAAISAVINGGYYYRPHVVSDIYAPSGALKRSFDGILLRQAVSSDVSALVKSYMKSSVDNGTSKYAKVDGFSMGGKTGTAQTIPRGNGKYVVSFVGFVPCDDPQVIIYCVVDQPNVEEQADNRYPQWIARDILQQILPYMNIYPDEPSSPENPYLARDFDRPTGDADTDVAADTGVPEMTGDTDGSETGGGNTMETDGYTNEEAGIDE